MNKSSEMIKANNDGRVDYEFSQRLKCAVRGKPAMRKNVVTLAPDVAAAFPNEQAVNEALRIVMQLSKIPAGHSA